MSSVLLGELEQFVSAHGYWVVALIVGLESMGLPLPGETILVLAAIYAATEPSFNVGEPHSARSLATTPATG